MYILVVLIERQTLVEARIEVQIPDGVLIQRQTFVEVCVEMQLLLVLIDEEPVFYDQPTTGEDVLDLVSPERVSLSLLEEREQ